MSRITPTDREALPAELKDLWDQFTAKERDFTNQARVLAHSPEAFKHLYGLVSDLRSNSGLSERLIEIAVVTTSKLNECPYCVAHHGTALQNTGLPTASVDSILEPEVPGFNETEHIVRDYAQLLVKRPWGIRDSIFEDLKRHFDERQIVELTVRVGLCALFNTFNQALEIPVEETYQAAASKAGQ